MNPHNHPHGHTHGIIDPSILATKRGIWAVKWSFIALMATTTIQALVVYFSGSVALLGDTVHNLGDAFTAIPIGLAFIFGQKKTTKRFTYGYGRLEDGMQIFLIIWFLLTGLSVAFVAYDLMTNTPEMKVMKWGWLMVTLYTGIFGLIIYIFSCREPVPYTHEKFIAPLWKQTVGSSIHCMAGDATGVIVAAFITTQLNLPMGLDSVLEYIAGFIFGLFIFQALFMKDMFGGSYTQAVLKTCYPEFLSMNFVMAGMLPVMIILMTLDPLNMEATSLRFWGIMSLASLVGGIFAFPVNWWLVKNKLKHGMGTERALGKGGEALGNKTIMNGMLKNTEHILNTSKVSNDQSMKMMKSNVSTQNKFFVALLSLLFLVQVFLRQLIGAIYPCDLRKICII